MDASRAMNAQLAAAAMAAAQAQVQASAQNAGVDPLIVDTLSEVVDERERRKRSAAEMDVAGDEYDDDDDDDASNEYGTPKDDGKDGKRGAKQRQRRHNWQPKYEMEFGLLPIERDATTGDVTLAMCGFCKAFGREGKYEQLMQPDADQAADNKKRRRRSLTTTKFFRAFRVDNIRSHLLGAHPRRWNEYEMLSKQEGVRARFLQMHGEFQYDGLPIDDVVLSGSALSADSDIAYAQAQAQALSASIVEPQHSQSGQAAAASVGGITHASQLASAVSYVGPRAHFDYEKHLVQQLALDRERLEFEKAKFQQEVELRERELAQQKEMMEQQRELHDKRLEAAELESSKFARLVDIVREALVGAGHVAAGNSLV